MKKQIIVECTKGFKAFNKVIRPGEANELNENEIFKLLTMPGLKLYEVVDEETRIKITKDNYKDINIAADKEGVVVVDAPVAPPVDEEVIVDETPVDESPVDETPVDETPEAPAEEEVIVDETLVDETPEAPVEEVIVDETPAEEEVIVDETPVDETPEAPVEEEVVKDKVEEVAPAAKPTPKNNNRSRNGKK